MNTNNPYFVRAIEERIIYYMADLFMLNQKYYWAGHPVNHFGAYPCGDTQEYLDRCRFWKLYKELEQNDDVLLLMRLVHAKVALNKVNNEFLTYGYVIDKIKELKSRHIDDCLTFHIDESLKIIEKRFKEELNRMYNDYRKHPLNNPNPEDFPIEYPSK